MNRSLKFSLDYGNTGKLQRLEALYDAYATLVNHYLRLLDERSDYILRENEVRAAETPLSARYKQCAARQAMMIWKGWRRTWRKGCQKPTFAGAMQLDQRFLKVEAGANSFDYWVKLSTTTKGQRIALPFKSYGYANHYFDNWKLKKGGKIQNIDGRWFLILCFEKLTPLLWKTGEV